METVKIGHVGRRTALLSLMGKLSQGWFMASPDEITRAELAQAMQRLFGRERIGGKPEIFGRGIPFAFGDPGQLLSEAGFSDTPTLAAAIDTPPGFLYILRDSWPPPA